MYAYLNGKFTHKSPAQVTVDVNGIGFELNISLNTYSAIQHLNDGLLYTYLQVKEDGHVLFGFFDKQEKEMFMLLISVSGVGASTARMMLSSMKADEISKAIVQGNVKLLESVKGIGKKTAERLVLELKDKVSGVNQRSVTADTAWQISISAALSGLGFTGREIDQAIASVSVTALDQPLEEKLRVALLNLQSPQSRGGSRG
jgi:Holliday junction DNA helicase RuvA